MSDSFSYPEQATTDAATSGASKFFRQWSWNKWGNFPRNGQIRADVGQTCLPFFTTIFIVHSVLFAFPYGHYFHFSLFCYVCVRDVISMLFMSLMVVLMQQEFIDHWSPCMESANICDRSWILEIKHIYKPMIGSLLNLLYLPSWLFSEQNPRSQESFHGFCAVRSLFKNPLWYRQQFRFICRWPLEVKSQC